MTTLRNLLTIYGFEHIDPQLVKGIQAIIFASDDAVSIKKLTKLFEDYTKDEIEQALSALFFIHDDMGIKLVRSHGGYRFLTSPEVGTIVSKFLQAKPIKLGRASLETLTIIAYEQPITRQEIQDIRGTDPESSLKFLLDKGLIKIIGRKKEPGRPLLYVTTDKFLEVFGLTRLEDLPKIDLDPTTQDTEINLPEELFKGEDYLQYNEALKKFEEVFKEAEKKGMDTLYLENKIIETLKGDTNE